MKRYTTISIAAAVFVAIMLAFSPRSQWPTMAALIVGAVAIFAGLMTPTVRRAAQARRRLFFWTGVATLIVGAGVIVAALAFPSAISVELSADAFCAFLLVGIFLVWLPRMSAATEAAVETQKSLQATGPVGTDRISAVSEATGALSDPINRLTSFVRVVGPWFVAFCALPLVLEALNRMAKSTALSRGQATVLLLALLGLILVGYLILIIAGIQWTRFVATDHKPRWVSIPGGALWGWVWRLFIFGSIFRATQGIEPWLARRLPGVALGVLHALSEAVVYALAVLATPFALSLTAAALGATARAAEMRLRVLRTAGRKVYIGAAVVLAPFFVIAWLSDVFSGQLQGPTARMSGAYVYLIALFLTVTAFAGYLGRLYAKSDVVG